MSDNENIVYEKLVQEIYQALHNQDEVKIVCIQHNVKLLGKSGCKHQIDVYWEFEVAGIVYKVAIECKNWNSDVPIGKIRDFFGVLHDIGNIKGIVVTKIGYQSGAKKYADFYGIDLKEARSPTEKDWDGRVKDIIFQFVVVKTQIKKRNIKLDQDWFQENNIVKENENFSLSGNNDEIFLYDVDGNKIINFYDLEQKLPHSWERAVDLSHKYNFKDAYLRVDQKLIKIISIEYVYDLETTEEQIITEGESIVKAILKDVKSNGFKSLRTDGNIK